MCLRDLDALVVARRTNALAKNPNCFFVENLPVTVVVEFVVACIGQVHPEPRANGVEDLNCSVNPDLTLFKSLQV